MRVVSQNRNYSADFDRTLFWKQNNVIYGKIDDNSNIVFGSYKTNERADEVFLDMHNAYAPIGIITTNLTDEQAREFIGSVNLHAKIIQMDDSDAAITTYENIVYYMPEE